MSIIKKAIILCAPKTKTDPKAELTKMVEELDEYQARLVLSFVKNLFGTETSPDGHAAEVPKRYEEEMRDRAA